MVVVPEMDEVRSLGGKALVRHIPRVAPWCRQCPSLLVPAQLRSMLLSRHCTALIRYPTLAGKLKLSFTALTMSPKTQEPQIVSVTDLSSAEAKWVALKKVDFMDQTGTSRSWEIAVRKTTSKSGVDAVAMGNIFVHPSKPPSTMLVIQYRPPIGKYTIEWPAGLVDEHETPEEAAVREMKEETGYEGKILHTGPVLASDPGLTNATLQLVMMEVKLSEKEDIMPDQKLDEGELIERVMVPLTELYDRLLSWSAQDKYMVAGKLFYFAAGLHFAKHGGYV